MFSFRRSNRLPLATVGTLQVLGTDGASFWADTRSRSFSRAKVTIVIVLEGTILVFPVRRAELVFDLPMLPSMIRY